MARPTDIIVLWFAYTYLSIEDLVFSAKTFACLSLLVVVGSFGAGPATISDDIISWVTEAFAPLVVGISPAQRITCHFPEIVVGSWRAGDTHIVYEEMVVNTDTLV